MSSAPPSVSSSEPRSMVFAPCSQSMREKHHQCVYPMIERMGEDCEWLPELAWSPTYAAKPFAIMEGRPT